MMTFWLRRWTLIRLRLPLLKMVWILDQVTILRKTLPTFRVLLLLVRRWKISISKTALYLALQLL
jgi:hypothetical protein